MQALASSSDGPDDTYDRHAHPESLLLMALYISASRRRRRIIIAAALALVLGLTVGFLLGRAMVTTPREQADSVAATGRDLATRVDALTIEYEQAVDGTGDSVAKGVTEPLVGIENDLQAVLAKAPWLGAEARTALVAKVRGLRSDAASGMSAARFASSTADVSKLIRSTLGVR